MAVVWIMLPFPVCTQTLNGGQDAGGTTGIPSASADTQQQKITVPSGLTYTNAWVYQKHVRKKNTLEHLTIGSYYVATKVLWSGYTGSFSSATDY